MAKKPETNHRILEWNVQSKPENSPQSQHLTILLVNEPLEIGRIKERLFEAMRPLDNVTEITRGKLLQEDLRYDCFSFDTGTPPDTIQWSRIYGGRIRRNRELYDRKSPDGLQKYLDERLG